MGLVEKTEVKKEEQLRQGELLGHNPKDSDW